MVHQAVSRREQIRLDLSCELLSVRANLQFFFLSLPSRSPPSADGLPASTPLIDARNILRPETVESLFIAYQQSGDPIYREWGWEIFQAFEKHCKVETGGYASIDDVDSDNPIQQDRMET